MGPSYTGSCGRNGSGRHIGLHPVRLDMASSSVPVKQIIWASGALLVLIIGAGVLVEQGVLPVTFLSAMVLVLLGVMVGGAVWSDEDDE